MNGQKGEEIKKAMETMDPKKMTDFKYNEELRKKLQWASPADARYPNLNITRHCYMYYIDYNRCKFLKGDDYSKCNFFKNVYQDTCPGFWTEQWDEWMDEGRFPYDFRKYQS